jgi:hypothetical protein
MGSWVPRYPLLYTRQGTRPPRLGDARGFTTVISWVGLSFWGGRDRKRLGTSAMLYTRHLKHAARGPHAASGGVQCGPQTTFKIKKR